MSAAVKREPAAEALPQETVFELLSNQRRRYALEVLRAADGPLLVTDLATRVAVREGGVDAEALDSSRHQSVRISLYQSHLPRLDESGLLTYDRDEGVVELASAAAVCFRYLDGPGERGAVGSDATAAARSRPWGVYVGLVAGVFLALAALGVPPFAVVPGLAYAAVLAAAVAGLDAVRFGSLAGTT